jgi:uncharacterized protein (DUF2141 family)
MILRTIRKFFFFLIYLLASSFPLLAQNPVPFINQPLVPTAVAPGGPAFTLTVNGSGFVSGATVHWNGAARTTTFVSSSQLTAAIPASDIATAGTASITVANPAPGGGPSNRVFFPVTNTTRDVAFQGGVTLPGSSGFGNGGNVVTGDFTGTGKLDLISTGPIAHSVGYWRGNGDGTFQSIVAVPVSIGAYNFAVGDFNGDGKLDIISTGFLPLAGNPGNQEGAISVLLGNGDGTFRPFVTTQDPTIYNIYGSIAVGDVNGDGKLDLVAACTQWTPSPNGPIVSSGVCVYLGNGDGTFHSAFSQFYGRFTPSSIALGDFNGDGKLDIVETDSIPNSGNPIFLALLLGNGNGTFGPAQIVNETTNSASDSGFVAVADLDRDGTLDLIFVHDACLNLPPNTPCTYNLDFFSGNGDGTFKPPYSITGLPGGAPIFGDFNGDGTLDVVVGTTMLLLRTGSYSQYSLPPGGPYAYYAAGDFNGDGRLDLIGPTSSQSGYALQPLLQVAPTYDFDVALSSNYQTVVTGATATFTLTITPVNGPNGTVQPSLTGLPTGTAASFNPPTLIGPGSIVLSITTSSSTPTGSYPLVLSLTNGSIVHSGNLTLNVGPPGSNFGDFVGTFTPNYQNISSGQVATYQVQISSVSGFTGSVTLSVSGLPTGATGTFNPPVITGGSGTSTLTVTTTASTPNGQYSLTATGTSGSLTHSGTLVLNVNPPGTYFGDFTGTVTPTSTQTIKVGQAASWSIAIQPLYGLARSKSKCNIFHERMLHGKSLHAPHGC